MHRAAQLKIFLPERKNCTAPTRWRSGAILFGTMALATDSPLIPDEFFHALSMMVARMMFICEKECHLKPIELLILWHIKHEGATKEDRPVLVRREEMTRVLKEKFDY